MSNNPTETAIAIGSALTEAHYIEKTPYVVVPEGYHVEDLKKLLDKPTTINKTVRFATARSFIRYFNSFKTEHSAIFGNPDNGHIAGIIDAHSPASPDNERHVAHYQTPLSRQWKEWTAHNGKGMNQHDFTKHIEKNLLDIVSPASGEMLEISRGIQAKKEINFVSGLRLSDGSHQITYEENVQGTSAKGNIKIPEVFVLGLPVFKDGESYSVTAKLFYRIKDSQLVIWYELQNHEVTYEDALNAAWETIEKETEREIFHTDY